MKVLMHLFFWSSWVWRTVQAGVLCMVWWTVVTDVHLRAFGSVPPSDFWRGSYQKASSVWRLHRCNAECWGNALGHARTKAKIVNYRDQLWPIYPLPLCRCTWWMLCMMENVLGVKVACLWLCLDCVSCGLEFEIAFVPYFWGKLALMFWEFQIIRLLLTIYWPYWTYETTTQPLLRVGIGLALPFVSSSHTPHITINFSTPTPQHMLPTPQMSCPITFPNLTLTHFTFNFQLAIFLVIRLLLLLM